MTVEMMARTVNDAIIVPASALLKTPDGATTVMVVGADGKAHQVSVETGIRQGDRVQITKGLSGGEKVITSGAYGLPDNTKVKIAPRRQLRRRTETARRKAGGRQEGMTRHELAKHA